MVIKSRYTSRPENREVQAGRYIITPHTQRKSGEPSQKNDTPAHGSYGGLLFDPRWKARREEILARDQNCCIICQSTDELQVHHRQYHYIKNADAFRMPWDYPDHLLITLCKSCHNRGHSKFKVPTLII